MKEIFLKAIDNKEIIEITFDSKEKGIITRKCVPFDFGPSQKTDTIDKRDKYHMYDLDSPEDKHNLSIFTDQLISIVSTKENFDPAVYVTWSPTKWIYPRDWGDKS